LGFIMVKIIFFPQTQLAQLLRKSFIGRTVAMTTKNSIAGHF